MNQDSTYASYCYFLMLLFCLADGEAEYEIFSSEVEMFNVLYVGSTNRSLSGF